MVYFMRRRVLIISVIIPLCLLMTATGYYFPPVNERVSWRVDQWRTEIRYFFNPPQEVIFVPQEQIPANSGGAIEPLNPTETPTQTPTSTPQPTDPGPTATLVPSATPTIAPTPLPERVVLSGVKYEDQHNRWNYCGPANLSMSLTYWGWVGNRDVVGQYVKPNDKDKNVMPYEMKDFVEIQTSGFGLLIRSGGTIELVKRLVASGFPVLAEKGYYEYDFTGKYGWLGHYQFITGYDESQQALIVQDTYIKNGNNHAFPYQNFLSGWRSFNYLFMVVYPLDRENEVLNLLGPWADPAWADTHALEMANAEILTSEGVDEYFAWFNKGTSHVNLFEYGEAANAYDQAFRLYANLPDANMRPYRMLWYQTGPYKAYYYSGRYQDTIELATQTLYQTINEPVLEESFYWRALAREAKGDIPGAIEDLQKAVELNPNFFVGWSQLQRIQGSG
jgi:hypothetical protein